MNLSFISRSGLFSVYLAVFQLYSDIAGYNSGKEGIMSWIFVPAPLP